MIIVEVTRAANSFGRTHLEEIRRAYEAIAKIVADGQEAGEFRSDIDPIFASQVLLRRDRAAALRAGSSTVMPAAETDFDRCKGTCW